MISWRQVAFWTLIIAIVTPLGLTAAGMAISSRTALPSREGHSRRSATGAGSVMHQRRPQRILSIKSEVGQFDAVIIEGSSRLRGWPD